ncbi:MAG: hypothetical protein ABI679_11820 [Gemmatimonadota bacterium]
MVSLAQLWIPILVSAVIVFFASSILHMVFKYHRSDMHGFKNEDEVREVLRRQNAAPGQYFIPYCEDMKEMQQDSMKKKFVEGPVAIVTMRPAGMMNMGPLLGQWLVYCVVMSIFSAYVASVTLPVGTAYMTVFRVVATVAWLAYSAAHISGGIWKNRPASTVVKDVIDGLIYALLTAGTFGWLWPR